MAKVFPFKAVMYDPRKVGSLSRVVTQPYDKISDKMREQYYAASEFNLVRVIRGKSFPTDNEADNVYTRAQAHLHTWLKRGILRQSEKPAFFAYFQDYEVPGTLGIRKTRKGFIGLGKLEDYSAGVVFPHEQTLSAPKEDRLKLLRTTRTHFGQIFMLYSDPAHAIDKILDEASSHPPDICVTDEYGVVHSVWKIEGEAKISEIKHRMENQKLIIADGHHRYETALNFRNECRVTFHPELDSSESGELPAYEKVMMTFVNTEGEGLTILPTHRIVFNLPHFDLKNFIIRAQEYFNLVGFKYFTPSERQQKLEQFRHELTQVGPVIHTLGLRAQETSNFYLMKLKGTLNLSSVLSEIPDRLRQLDVVILHKIILELCLGISPEDVLAEKYIRYVREFEAGLNAVDKEGAQLCFFLNPTPIEQVRDIAFSGGRLPQKSTDFYPKLLSGLAAYSLDSI